MLVLRPTRRLRTLLKAKFVEDPPPSTGRLGDWYANDVRTRAGKLLVFVNETRLVIVIPSRDKARLGEIFRARLLALLDRLGVPEEAARAEVAEAAEIVFAATADRSLVGSMNDICFHVMFHLGRSNISFDELEVDLAGMPHVKQAEAFPDRAVRSRLGGIDPSLH